MSRYQIQICPVDGVLDEQWKTVEEFDKYTSIDDMFAYPSFDFDEMTVTKVMYQGYVGGNGVFRDGVHRRIPPVWTYPEDCVTQYLFDGWVAKSISTHQRAEMLMRYLAPDVLDEIAYAFVIAAYSDTEWCFAMVHAERVGRTKIGTIQRGYGRCGCLDSRHDEFIEDMAAIASHDFMRVFKHRNFETTRHLHKIVSLRDIIDKAQV